MIVQMRINGVNVGVELWQDEYGEWFVHDTSHCKASVELYGDRIFGSNDEAVTIFLEEDEKE